LSAAELRRAVAWRDLVALSPASVLKELALPLPWLGLSLYLAGQGLWLCALPASFIFFLTGLRLCHGAFHDSLGLPRRATEAVMSAYSILMLGSMHAIQWNHLRHHRDCLGADDIEGCSARLGALGAIAVGPLFPIRLHRAALRRQVRWVRAELAGNLAWVIAAFGVIACAALRYHVVAMVAGQCLTSFFAVWTVHRGSTGGHVVARTIRSRLKNALTFSMFFHAEHHLFPAVPTGHLHILARRLDLAAPELAKELVF
jgi:fatty acid desaturase